MLQNRIRSVNWKVLVKRIGVPKNSAGNGLKRVLAMEPGRKRLAEWLHEHTPVAAAHAATMEAGRKKLEQLLMNYYNSVNKTTRRGVP